MLRLGAHRATLLPVTRAKRAELGPTSDAGRNPPVERRNGNAAGADIFASGCAVRRRGSRLAHAACLGLLCVHGSARAWVFPEHREIALSAVGALDASYKVELEQYWQQARVGAEGRLCSDSADSHSSATPLCIDWAALTAIAGDHACSSRELMETVRSSDWMLEVTRIGAQQKIDLQKIPVTAPATISPDASILNLADVLAYAQRDLESNANRAQRLSVLRSSDTRLLHADPDYATRAAGNTAHFLQARRRPDHDVLAYRAQVANPGGPISALGVYAWYHTSALQEASRLAQGDLSPEQKQLLARSMLSDEAFALHFLEDIYSAGHVAGSWGNASQRQGTHDFYNERGLEVFTWAGGSASVVLMGDAHMRPEDLIFAAGPVRLSLMQVLDVAAGRVQGEPQSELPTYPDFNVCRNDKMPAPSSGPPLNERYPAQVAAVVALMPVPGLSEGLGALPRFRSEIGPFVGLATAVDARMINGGFDQSQTRNGAVGGVEVAARLGVGLEGVLGDSGDGLVYGQLGVRATTPSTNKFTELPTDGTKAGSLYAAIPAEYGLAARFRMPFYVVPFDLLFLSPMYFFDRAKYTQLVAVAANGGLIPWQQGLATRIGRFQFVLGREIGLTLYGLDRQAQFLAIYGDQVQAVDYKSIGIDMPVLEYRPYRKFSTDQSSSLLFQLFVSDEIPYDVAPDGPPGTYPVHTKNIWSVGLRMTFTWRRYW